MKLIAKDVQDKIIDFIKKSPIGVTSSEIAKFLGFNRMTIIKYLAVIKEKALIDFKQLGMAKLWYIPVNLSKETFLENALLEFTRKTNDQESKNRIKKASIAIAQNIEEMYKGFHGAGTLSYEQIIFSLVDAYSKIGGHLSVLEKGKDLIILKHSKSPFGGNISKSPSLWEFTSALCGVITARNLGYSRVEMKKPLPSNPQERLIYIFLKKP